MTEFKIFDYLMINFILRNFQCHFFNGRRVRNVRLQNDQPIDPNIQNFNLDNRKIVLITKDEFVLKSAMVILVALYNGLMIRLVFAQITPKNFRYYKKMNRTEHSFSEIFFEFNISGLLHHFYYLVMITFFVMAAVMGCFVLLTRRYRFILIGQLVAEDFSNEARKNALIAYLIIYTFLPILPNYPYHIYAIQHNTFSFMLIFVVLLSTQGFVSRMRYYNMVTWL